jgi:FAD/FMN-containing dehydrogenase
MHMDDHRQRKLTTIGPNVVRELRMALGEDAVCASWDEIAWLVRDESWLSPILQREFERRAKERGAGFGVQAVVRPSTEDDVIKLARIAASQRIPLILRGAGTSNFGLIAPEDGGIIVDLRGLTGEPQVGDRSVRAPAGTLIGDMERAARVRGRELPVLTTTYATATIGGFLCGGHVGLGSSMHGAVWDGIVEAIRVVTVEETPRTLTLRGNETHPLLHTFGVVGIITEVTMRAGPVHDWLEAVSYFPTFVQASAFATEISHDLRYCIRIAAAQEEHLMRGIRQLAPVHEPGAGVLMMFDHAQTAEVRKLVTAHGGRLVEWRIWQPDLRRKPSVAQMVYGHRMLWVKQYLPKAAFCHIYYDPNDPEATVKLLKNRFGDDILVEMKFIRSKWMLRALGLSGSLLPAALCVVCDGSPEHGRLDEVLEFCDDNGIRYQNSHTNVIEDNGLFPDVTPIVAMKSQFDPYNLLNRGRLRSATVRP